MAPADTIPNPLPSPKLTRLASLLDEAEADARALYEAKQTGSALGPVTNFPRLDKEIGKAMLPGVHIVHGKPGAGKSAFGLQIAASCACPALYVTCEMRPLVLLKRLAARVTGTYLGKFSSGELTPDAAMNLYRRAASEAPGLAILDATEAPADLAAIHGAAMTTRQLLPDHRHLLIVVDSLHSWADAQAIDVPEYDRLNEALQDLRGLAVKIGCPVLAVSERNRASMRRGGLDAGAGTRKIEYGAELVLDLDAPEDAQEDANGEKAITLKIAKNRNGTAGREIRLLFHGALQRFREIG